MPDTGPAIGAVVATTTLSRMCVPRSLLWSLLLVVLVGCGPAGDGGSAADGRAADGGAAGEGVGGDAEPAATATPGAEREDRPDAGDPVGDAAWVEREPAPFALTEVAAAAFSGAVWTAGGFDAGGAAVAAVLIYDPVFDGWEEGPDLPRQVHHAALVAAGDELYLLGGYDGSGFDTPSASVTVLDASTGEWAEGPALPEPRAAGAAAWDGTRVVYGGGVGPDGLAGDVWALEGGEWVAVGTLEEPREHLAAAGDGEGRVWLMGGRTGGLASNLATVDLVEADTVTRIGALPTARGGVAGLHITGVGACALGGEDPDRTFDEVECMDADGAVTTLPPLAVARHGLGAAVLEDVAYAVLGGPDPGLAVSDALEALTLTAESNPGG
jgi:hypothetical protein